MSKKIYVPTSKRVKRGYGVKLIWVLNNLSEEKLNHADKLAPSADDLMEFLMQAVDAGIDIKVGWDDYSECYQVTAIGAWDNYPSTDYACSARSDRDMLDALSLIWYKVVVSADWDLSSIPSEKQVGKMRG